MTTSPATTPDLDAFIALDRRVREGRTRIDDAREKGFDVTEMETRWQALRNERDALADRLFSATRGEEAA